MTQPPAPSADSPETPAQVETTEEPVTPETLHQWINEAESAHQELSHRLDSIARD